MKRKWGKQPPERFELSTPGLQDQCSNPWATEAEITTQWNFTKQFFFTTFASEKKNLGALTNQYPIFLKWEFACWVDEQLHYIFEQSAY